MLQLLCGGMFVTDSLLRSICYDSKRKFACYRLILEVFW